jgi:heme oxygenase
MPASLDTPIMDRLKSETRHAHDRTEAIAFSAAMMEGRLPKDRFVGQLRSYRDVHDALETNLRASTHPAVRAIWTDDLAKTQLLDADLAHFGARSSAMNDDVALHTREFVAWINATALAAPVALIGALYVLEGSTLGAMVLKPRIATAYGLEGDAGLAYYSPYGHAVMPHWKAFKERVNTAVADPRDHGVILDAANETFRRIGDILAALSHGL